MGSGLVQSVLGGGGHPGASMGCCELIGKIGDSISGKEGEGREGGLGGLVRGHTPGQEMTPHTHKKRERKKSHTSNILKHTAQTKRQK